MNELFPQGLLGATAEAFKDMSDPKNSQYYDGQPTHHNDKGTLNQTKRPASTL
jgi:hypothetical protein